LHSVLISPINSCQHANAHRLMFIVWS
jgi:hypothetical protein